MEYEEYVTLLKVKRDIAFILDSDLFEEDRQKIILAFLEKHQILDVVRQAAAQQGYATQGHRDPALAIDTP